MPEHFGRSPWIPRIMLPVGVAVFAALYDIEDMTPFSLFRQDTSVGDSLYSIQDSLASVEWHKYSAQKSVQKNAVEDANRETGGETFRIVNFCPMLSPGFSVAYVDTLNRIVTRGWFRLEYQDELLLSGIAGHGLWISDSLNAPGVHRLALHVSPHQFFGATEPVPNIYSAEQAAASHLNWLPTYGGDTLLPNWEAFTYVKGDYYIARCDNVRPRARPHDFQTFFLRYTP